MISYLVDVYRGEEAVNNPFKLALYICFFPQLIAGPIVKYKDIKKYLSIKYRRIKIDNIYDGLRRFIIGLSKKVLIANNLANIVYIVFDHNPNMSRSIMLAWFGAIAFTLELYYDFSGYSDMAIGLAKLFGFNLKENFNYPLVSKNIKDFWRRWHISLSNFFKDYVYIPLGGNKCSYLKHVFNLLLVWLLTGIWHGSSKTFILWGLIYGILIIIEEKIFKYKLNKYILTIYRIFTFIIIVILFVVFRCDNISFSSKYILSMFGIGASSFIDSIFIFQFSNYFLLFIISIIFMFPIYPMLEKKYSNSIIYKTISLILIIICFITSISFIYMNGFNPFLYFIF